MLCESKANRGFAAPADVRCASPAAPTQREPGAVAARDHAPGDLAHARASGRGCIVDWPCSSAPGGSVTSRVPLLHARCVVREPTFVAAPRERSFGAPGWRQPAIWIGSPLSVCALSGWVRAGILGRPTCMGPVAPTLLRIAVTPDPIPAPLRGEGFRARSRALTCARRPSARDARSGCPATSACAAYAAAASGGAGSTVTRAYDAASRLTSEALALANGALSGTTVSAATYTVGYDYDADNRLTDITYPTGSVVERSYTDRNQLDTVKLNAVQIADRAYDNAGRLTSTVLGNGLTESRGYIANDNLIATIAVPGVTNFTYTYDANKRKLSETDGIIAANTQTFSYDDQDRLTAWTRPSAPGGDSQSWSLSAVGDWTSTTRNSVVENRTHTAVHELTGINSNPLSYDAKGNLSGDDRNVSYAWDPENRLASAIIPSSASPTFFAANAKYQYDALGRRIAKTVNGQTTVYLCGGAQVLVEIDRKAIPSQAQLNGSESDGTVANASLPVASGGVLPGTGVIRINFQPATATIPAGYYADKGSVYGVRTNGMHYGWALNATSDVVARNGAVPVPELDTLALMDPTSSGTTPPANVWEVALPNGSYPVIVVAGDPLHRNQTNDLQIENQSVTDLDPSSAQTYEQGDYDGYAVIATVADGKLSISQSANGINAKLCFVEIGPEGTAIDSATLTRLADLMQQATDHTALMAGATTGSREYVYATYVDELVSYTVGSTKYFVHSNHLYSPSAVTNAAGQVVERYRYDAYGKQTTLNAAGTVELSKSAVNFDRGFTGYILDGETGLYYARARMYSAGLGRFVSRDPKGYVDGYSTYFAYFLPNHTDPTGKNAWANCVNKIHIQCINNSAPQSGQHEPDEDKQARISACYDHARSVCDKKQDSGTLTDDPPIGNNSGGGDHEKFCGENWDEVPGGSELLVNDNTLRSMCNTRYAGCVSRCSKVCQSDADKHSECEKICTRMLPNCLAGDSTMTWNNAKVPCCSCDTEQK